MSFPSVGAFLASQLGVQEVMDRRIGLLFKELCRRNTVCRRHGSSHQSKKEKKRRKKGIGNDTNKDKRVAIRIKTKN